VGPGAAVRIRKDSKWNVPEPEFTLVVNSRMQIVGYTIGNDMSSRDIEGENPLYLPQAKVYDACCSLGPWVTLADDFANRAETAIAVKVERAGAVAYEGSTSLAQMARDLEDLVQWLGRDMSFPEGVFLLTGTGIVPDSDFTLQPDDVVTINIDGIGELSNPVIQG
jgi:2-dehydro-3-deoxy-D-arabinonate dehydratase